MPAGVDVLVEDGFATIDFVDRAKRGPGLGALLAVGGPELIETLTRTGPRTLFRVPEGNAREAGLIDGATAFIASTTGVPREGVEVPLSETVELDLVGSDEGGLLPSMVQGWPDGEPAEDWKRTELDAYAAAYGIATDDLPNKTAVLAAILAAS